MGAHDIEAQVKIYTKVFLALLVLTVVTVAASYIDLSVPDTIALALFIATIKGSLVACYFMHLIDERKWVYGTLILTVLFFIVLMFGPLLWAADPITQG